MGDIIVSNLSKGYKQYTSRWERLAEWLDPSHHPRHHMHWVFKDLNFQIKTGEAVGIIGTNGAGKSTLLKLITGTTAPTSGKISIQGHVAALLELGMGFHSDFTGRQNAIMAGQLLGYSAIDMKNRMDEIIEFSEIEDYIDQPVRFYSSGMQMRLAFAVATSARPDILIIDEALSVGDAYFQHKSFDRIRKFRQQGTTLMIVSHDRDAIQSICDRAILLNSGAIETEGNPQLVMDYYNALLSKRQDINLKQSQLSDGKIQIISGKGDIIIETIFLSSAKDAELSSFEVGQEVTLTVQAYALKDVPELVVGYMIKDRLGGKIFGTNTSLQNISLANISKDERIAISFTFNGNLGPGTYSISIALHGGVSHMETNYEWRDFALFFDVVNNESQSFVGTNWLPPKIEVRR